MQNLYWWKGKIFSAFMSNMTLCNRILLIITSLYLLNRGTRDGGRTQNFIQRLMPQPVLSSVSYFLHPARVEYTLYTENICMSLHVHYTYPSYIRSWVHLIYSLPWVFSDFTEKALHLEVALLAWSRQDGPALCPSESWKFPVMKGVWRQQIISKIVMLALDWQHVLQMELPDKPRLSHWYEYWCKSLGKSLPAFHRVRWIPTRI